MGSQKINYSKMSDDEIIELFIKNYKHFNPKNAVDFQNKTNNIPSQHILRTRLNMTYGEMCIYCGLRERRRPKRDSSVKLKDKINKFLEICDKLGYVPTKEKFLNELGVKSIYLHGFTYEEFLEKCGVEGINYKNWKNFSKVDDDYFINKYIDIAKIYGSDNVTSRHFNKELYEILKRFGSFNNFKRTCDKNLILLDKRVYSKFKISELLTKVYTEFGKLSYKDTLILLSDEDEFPKSIGVILYYFNIKSFSEIWDIILDDHKEKI